MSAERLNRSQQEERMINSTEEKVRSTIEKIRKGEIPPGYASLKELLEETAQIQSYDGSKSDAENEQAYQELLTKLTKETERQGVTEQQLVTYQYLNDLWTSNSDDEFVARLENFNKQLSPE